MHFLQCCSSLLIPSKLAPQVLINSIYYAFTASKIPSTKVSFQIWKQTGPKGLNLEDTRDEEQHQSCIKSRGGGGGGGGNISKPTPFIYLAFEKTDPFIYLIIQNVDLFLYCPLIFYTHFFAGC